MAVAIDWGNTNTVVAIESGLSEHVLRVKGKPLIPSYMGYSDDGLLECIGYEAKNRVRKGDPNVVAGIKKLIGVGYSDNLREWAKRVYGISLLNDNGKIAVKIGKTSKYPEKIAQEYFTRIRELLLEELRERGFLKKLISGTPNIDECIATCPAHYTDTQREVLKKCILNSGFILVKDKLIAEPVAPSGLLPIGRNNNTLVIDWGGGTLDFTLIDPQRECRYLSAIQEKYGGVDMDMAIINGLISTKQLPSNLKAGDSAIVREYIETLKELMLSPDSEDSQSIEFNLPEIKQNIIITVTRKDIKNWLDDILIGAMNGLDNVMGEIQSQGAIDRCILVGGPTRSQLIRNEIRQILPSKIRIEDIRDPITSVARGALKIQSDDKILVDDFGVCVVQFGLNIGSLLLKSQQTYPVQSVERKMELRGIRGQDVKILLWARKCNRADEQYYYKTSSSYTFMPHFNKNRIARIRVSLKADNRGVISATVVDETTNQIMQLRQIGQDVLKDMDTAPFRSANEGYFSFMSDAWEDYMFHTYYNPLKAMHGTENECAQDEAEVMDDFIGGWIQHSDRNIVKELIDLINQSIITAEKLCGRINCDNCDLSDTIDRLDSYSEGLAVSDIEDAIRLLDELYENLIKLSAEAELMPALKEISLKEMQEIYQTSTGDFEDMIGNFDRNRYERMVAKLSEIKNMISIECNENTNILSIFLDLETLIGLHKKLRLIENYKDMNRENARHG